MTAGGREIELTKGFVALVDEADFEWLSQWRWRYKERGDGRQGYAVRTTGSAGRQRTIYMHRLIFGAEAPEVDHINRDRLDNRRANLRGATRAENSRNFCKTPTATSPYKGVSWDRGVWVASISPNGRAVYLGRHLTSEAAARAYDEAARRHFGEFAYLNFPEAV